MTNEINIVQLNNNVLTVEVTSPGPQGPVGFVASIDDIGDVTLSGSIVDKSVLAYNSSTSKWENINILDGGTP